MNKKQKKMLARIIIAAVLLIVLHFVPIMGIPRFICYLAVYLVIGYDIVKKAFKGIKNGQVFDENFLMAIATIGAFALAVYEKSGDYNESMDKTGTITSGQPEVTDLLPADGISEQELLTMAFALEKKSEHPLAKAILKHAEEQHLTAPEVTDFHALPGNGLSAVLEQETLIGGSMKFISSQVNVPATLSQKAEKLAEEGKTPLQLQ